jgi:uncharacterized RmlC-like cupin family protein
MPPGTRARAHMHAAHESAIYVISGRGEFWWGARLEHHAVAEAGDFIHIEVEHARRAVPGLKSKPAHFHR